MQARRSECQGVELSDEWTLEYCFAAGPLSDLVYEAINDGTGGIEDLPKDKEERAIYLYGLIESQSQKTKVAYSLASLLKAKFSAKRIVPLPDADEAAQAVSEQNFQTKAAELREELRGKLPAYIVRAIEYVTESTEAPIGPPPTEAVEESNATQPNQ